MGNDNNDKSSGSSGSSNVPANISTPSFKEIKQTAQSRIHSGVRTAVDTANRVLSEAYRVQERVRTPVASALNQAETYGERAVTSGRRVYEQRHQYAPYWVAGSALGGGFLVGVRRGRVPGLLVGTVVGTIAYVGLYGDDSALRSAPEFSLPNLRDKVQEKLPSMPSFPGSKKGD